MCSSTVDNRQCQHSQADYQHQCRQTNSHHAAAAGSVTDDDFFFVIHRCHLPLFSFCGLGIVRAALHVSLLDALGSMRDDMPAFPLGGRDSIRVAWQAVLRGGLFDTQRTSRCTLLGELGSRLDDMRCFLRDALPSSADSTPAFGQPPVLCELWRSCDCEL